MSGDLNPHQFTTKPFMGGSLVEAHDDEGKVTGRLHAVRTEDFSHEVGYVMVEPEHRRKGIATGLLHHARQHLGEVRHSTNLSVDGRPWAKAVP